MSFESFHWNEISRIYPSVRSHTVDPSEKNPYAGKFMVRMEDGLTCICSYCRNPEEDSDLSEYVRIHDLECTFGLWVPLEYSNPVPARKQDLWYPMDYVFDMLSGKPTPSACWEFGVTMAQFAIPALTAWIEKGVYFAPSMTEDEWKETLVKIREAFYVSLVEMSSYDVSPEEREQNQKIRDEGFSLMSKHYLDLWD